MNKERWATVQEIFSRAIELPAELDEDQRRRALLELCAGDDEVFAEVTEMLDEDARDNPLLDGGLNQAARTVLDLGPLPSLVQKQIGPYRLLRLLGEGGMGVVYLAERTDIGGQVAIKLLRDAWLSPMRRQRFQIEQLTLAQLNHPSIARIYDANTLEDGTPWFVMEYAEGLPLAEHRKTHPGTLREFLELFRRICEAVQYAHNHAIIHRDLKPSNILVSESGEVKLLDFGIAKQLNQEESQNLATITGLRLMTLAYAAPEQLAGGTVGLYTDVYALGVLLYELVTGRLPRRAHAGDAENAVDHWPNEKPSAVVRREKPEIRRQLSKAEWADLDVLALKALEPDVVRRYGTAGALARDLSALLEGHPLDARPPEWSYTLSKFVHRNRRGLMAAAAVALLIAATIVFYTVRLARARDAAVREAARTLRIQQFTESLFDGGDKSAGPAVDLRAVELLDRGRNEAAGLSADPAMQADMQETLGGIYQKLGKLDVAEPLLSSALSENRQILGPNDPKVARSLVALGLLRKDQGKFDDAESLARQGLAISRRASSATSADVAASLVALGSILEVRGKYDEAKQDFEEALRTQPQPAGDSVARAENLLELANITFYQGHYDESAQFNRRALDIDRRLFGEQHPAVAEELNNLGAIEADRGNYAESESFYRQSLAIVEKWYGPDHPETAANLTALAQTLTLERRFTEAQALLERALSIQKQGSGPIRATVATTLNQLGIVAFNAKNYDAARIYFNQAIETWKQIYGDQHPYIANAISNLGSICQQQKDYPCAEKMYREAVRRFDSTSAESVNDAIAHVKLGRTLLSEAKFSDAETHSLAGYNYLVKHVSPTNSYLANARKDLAAIYDGLHQPQQAARFRAELTQGQQTP
jgi:serine/threonine protein kinase/tetratricopeptide (TPR) repeat protein